MTNEIILDEFSEYPKTRKEAIEVGSKAYFTQKPCKRGHIDLRLTSNTACYACNRELKKYRYEKNPEPIKKVNRKSRRKHLDERRKATNNWGKNNREKTRQNYKEWVKRNPEKHKEIQQNYKDTRKANKINLKHDRARQQLNYIIKGRKAGKAWDNLFNFSCIDFKLHIQCQFRDGMTWENHGSHWQVDHKKPICKCQTFEEAWTLKNLQPLLVKENLYKAYKYNDD